MNNGMKFMDEKIVIVTGAGFSAPAKIPIQNSIISEMALKDSPSILLSQIKPNSDKFLQAYIEAGIFLLSEYTNESIDDIKKNYNKINRQLAERATLVNVMNSLTAELNDYLDKTAKIENEISKTFFEEILRRMSNSYIIPDSLSHQSFLLLKEQIRQIIENHKKDIILEDIFTWFDKTILTKEHGNKFTYQEMDRIKFSILRLFVYYFGIRSINHDFNHHDYLNAIEFISRNLNNISIITTNWDIIFEKYLEKANISLDLCLNNPYFSIDGKGIRVSKKEVIKFVKIHGSINWCKCLNCGSISIVQKKPFDKFLFNDDEIEACSVCKRKSELNSIQLQPEIITPTMMKSISNQLYNNLWREASYVLSNAKKIIFIGYSLPIADFEFRYLLKRSILPSTDIDVILINTDNPENLQPSDNSMSNFLPPKRYQELFSQNKVSFFYDGFGQYFQEQNTSSTR